MKVLVITRHELLPTQQLAIKEALNPTELVFTPQYGGAEQNAQLKADGIDAVVTIALPPHLLAQLSKDFPLYVFKMESGILFSNEAEAQAWKAEQPDRRTLLPSPEGTYRGLEFVGLSKVEVTIREEPVWVVG